MTEVDFKNLKDYSLLMWRLEISAHFYFDTMNTHQILLFNGVWINSSQNVCSSRSYKNVERNFYHYYFVIITCVFFFYSVLINKYKCNVAMFFKILNLLGLTSDSYEKLITNILSFRIQYFVKGIDACMLIKSQEILRMSKKVLKRNTIFSFLLRCWFDLTICLKFAGPSRPINWLNLQLF